MLESNKLGVGNNLAIAEDILQHRFVFVLVLHHDLNTLVLIDVDVFNENTHHLACQLRDTFLLPKRLDKGVLGGDALLDFNYLFLRLLNSLLNIGYGKILFRAEHFIFGAFNKPCLEVGIKLSFEMSIFLQFSPELIKRCL